MCLILKRDLLYVKKMVLTQEIKNHLEESCLYEIMCISSLKHYQNFQKVFSMQVWEYDHVKKIFCALRTGI